MDEKGFEPSSHSLQGWYVSVVTTRPERLRDTRRYQRASGVAPAVVTPRLRTLKFFHSVLFELSPKKLDRADSHRILKAPVGALRRDDWENPVHSAMAPNLRTPLFKARGLPVGAGTSAFASPYLDPFAHPVGFDPTSTA